MLLELSKGETEKKPPNLCFLKLFEKKSLKDINKNNKIESKKINWTYNIMKHVSCKTLKAHLDCLFAKPKVFYFPLRTLQFTLLFLLVN